MPPASAARGGSLDPSTVTGLLTSLVVIVGVLVVGWLVFTVVGVRVIGSSQVGAVEKEWWSRHGSLKDQIIALKGEAGYQPDVLRAGVHFLSPSSTASTATRR